MSQKSTTLFLMLVIVVSLGLFVSTAHAQYGLDITGPKAGFDQKETVELRIQWVVNTVLSFVAIIMFAMVVYAGIRWMTARGNDEHLSKAKEALEAAGIGLALVLVAYALSTFIIGKFTTPAGSAGAACQQDSECNGGLCSDGVCVAGPNGSASASCHVTTPVDLSVCGTYSDYFSCIAPCRWDGSTCVGDLCGDITNETTCAALGRCAWY